MKKQNEIKTKQKKTECHSPKTGMFGLFCLLTPKKECFALLLKNKLMRMVAIEGDLQQHYPHNLN